MGCGGNSTPPPPTLSNAAGTWVGTLTSTPTSSDPTSHTSTMSLSISQGTETKDASGFPMAPLTAAFTITTPNCPALTSGTGIGTITGHVVQLTFTLNDGGNMTFLGATSSNLTSTYAFNTGTCAPQSGTSALNKQ